MDYKNNLLEYDKKKKRLINEFKKRFKNNSSISLGKSTSNLFRHRKIKNTVNVKDFNKVIDIDSKKLIADVEAMITYEDLVAETLKFNFMPAVVPELKSITIGGALTGIGIESSSFKYGLVHETIEEFEVILSNSSVIKCSKNNNKDLFFAFPNSYGTFGYAIRIKVKLVPVKNYVLLTHIKFNNNEYFFTELEKYCNIYRNNKSTSFIDGSVFSNNEMYITLAECVDKPEFLSDYTHMNIYYKSIKDKKVDYLTIKDYIWRWDTDWFWCSKHFGVQNKFIRFLFGKKRLRSDVYWKIRAFNGKYRLIEKINKLFNNKSRTESVVQDVEIPIENCNEFLRFFHEEIGIKPVWICPLKSFDKNINYSLFEMNHNKLYINFGFWDVIKTVHEDGYYNRKIELKVKEFDGKKSLYSTSYYSEKEFWNLYNKKVYDNVKKKYDSKLRLKNLYDKCIKSK